MLSTMLCNWYFSRQFILWVPNNTRKYNANTALQQASSIKVVLIFTTLIIAVLSRLSVCQLLSLFQYVSNISIKKSLRNTINYITQAYMNDVTVLTHFTPSILVISKITSIREVSNSNKKNSIHSQQKLL